MLKQKRRWALPGRRRSPPVLSEQVSGLPNRSRSLFVFSGNATDLPERSKAKTTVRTGEWNAK